MSIQYLSSSTILRIPATCPSMYESRFITSGFRSSCISRLPFFQDSACCFSSKTPQPQRIADHCHRRERHGRRREDRRILPQEWDERRKDCGRNQDHVVAKGPEEVLLDGAQRSP